MRATSELPDMEVITEIDDVHIARMIVDEQHCIGKIDRMWYMARWVAKLREHYVATGRDVEAAEAPPHSCHRCSDAAGCHSQGQCVFTGYPLRKMT